MSLPIFSNSSLVRFVAQIFNLLYRRFPICEAHRLSKRVSISTAADYKSAIWQSPGGRPPNLRYAIGILGASGNTGVP
jgi:hypothetical protein